MFLRKTSLSPALSGSGSTGVISASFFAVGRRVACRGFADRPQKRSTPLFRSFLVRFGGEDMTNICFVNKIVRDYTVIRSQNGLFFPASARSFEKNHNFVLEQKNSF
jgi:hypothetical protein